MFTRKLTRSEYASLPPDEQVRYRDWVHNGAVPETSENVKGTEGECIGLKTKAEEHTERVSSDSTDKVAGGSTDRVSDDSIDESINMVSDGSIDEPANTVSDDSSEESFDNILDDSDKEPVDDSIEETNNEVSDEPTDNSFDDVSDDFSFDIDFDTDDVSDDSIDDSTDDVSDDFSFDGDLNFDDEEPIFNDSDSNDTEVNPKASADTEQANDSFDSEEDINYDDLDSDDIEPDDSSTDNKSSIDEPDESDINYDDLDSEEDAIDSGEDVIDTEPDESGINYDDLDSEEDDTESGISYDDLDTDEDDSLFADEEDSNEESVSDNTDEDDSLFANEDDSDEESDDSNDEDESLFTDDDSVEEPVSDEDDSLFADEDNTDSEEDEDLFADETSSENKGNLFTDDDLFANEPSGSMADTEQSKSEPTDKVIDESDWSFNDEEDDLFGTDTIISQTDEEPISENCLALASAISEFTGTDMYAPDESEEVPNEQGIKPDETSAEYNSKPDETTNEQGIKSNGTQNEQGIKSDEAPVEPNNERLDELAQAISDFGFDDTESTQKPIEVEQKPVEAEQKPKKHFGKKPKKPEETKPNDKKPKPNDKSRKTHKKGLLIVGIVLIIALAGFVAFKFFTKGSSFTDDLNAIFDAQTGTFNYKFTVTSSAVGDSSNNNDKTANDFGKRAEATSKGTKDTGKTENAWTSDSDLATNYWDSPNYIVEVKGQKKSADKYSATIYLTTKDKSAELTDILVDKDNTYINAGKLMTYLNSTSDAYLHNLGKDLNLNTSAYIKCKSSDLVFNVFGLSNDASATGITQKTDRIALVRKMLTSTLSKYFKTDKKGNTDGTVLNLGAKDTDGILDSIRSLVQNSGNAYDSYISNAETLYSKDGYKVAKANKPLFVKSMNSMADYMSTHSNKDINLRVSGESDKYTSIDGADTQTVNLTSNYVLDGYNYTITGEFTHKAGKAKISDVKSAADFKDVNVLANFYTDFIMYLNPTNYDFTPSVESKDVFIDSLIKFADEESKGKIKLNKVNAIWFIKRYSNIEDPNALSTRDKESYDIYTKFKDTVHDTLVQGNDSADTTNKYSQVSAALPNNLTAQYTVNTNETTSGMLVVDVTYTNTTGEDIVVDNSKYKLVSDSGSTVTANDSTLIQGYDANFDMNLVPSTVTVSDTLQTKLYFVRHIDEGAASITFEDANLGALVNS
jgi:hypothetical protein